MVNFAALDTNSNDVLDDGDLNVSVGADTVIDLGAATGGAAGIDTIRVSGVTGLTAADFDFTTLIDPLDALV
ncbi:MAG: hypothetical protein IIC03_13005 [Proteobacteria bacterium]|nr:hypothetical protein [Pseudomonadota bacterium]